MTLREILTSTEQLSDDLVIYASKNGDWHLDKPAALILLEESVEVDMHLEDLTYFLEIEIAKEVVAVWKKWHGGREPSDNERVTAIIYYADHDAYLDG